MIWLVLQAWMLSYTCIEGLLKPHVFFYWGPNPTRTYIRTSATLISSVTTTVDVDYHVLSVAAALRISVPLQEFTRKEYILQSNDIFEQTDYFTLRFSSDYAFHLVLVILTKDKLLDIVRPLSYTDWGHMYTVMPLGGKPSVLVFAVKHMRLKIERHYDKEGSFGYTKIQSEVPMKMYNHLLILLHGNYHDGEECQGAVLEAADRFGVMYLSKAPLQYSSAPAVPDKLSGKTFLTSRFGSSAGNGKYYIVSQELEAKVDISTKGKKENIVLREIGNLHEIKSEMSASEIVSNRFVIMVFATQQNDQLSYMVPLERFKSSYILVVPLGWASWVQHLVTLIHRKVGSGKINLDGKILTPESSETVGEYIIYTLEINVTSVRINSVEEVKFGCFQSTKNAKIKETRDYYFDAFPHAFEKIVVPDNITASKKENVYSESYDNSIWRKFLNPCTYNEFEYICPKGFYSINCNEVCACDACCFFNGSCNYAHCEIEYYGKLCEFVDLIAFANCKTPKLLFAYDNHTCINMTGKFVYICFAREFVVRAVRLKFREIVTIVDELAEIEILSSENIKPYQVKHSKEYVDDHMVDMRFKPPLAVKIMKIRIVNKSPFLCSVRVNGGISIKELKPVYTVGGNSDSPHLSALIHDDIKFQSCMMTRDINELEIDIGQMVLIYLVIFYIPDISVAWTIKLELLNTNGSSVFNMTFTQQNVYTYFAIINKYARRISLRSIHGIFGICEVEAFAEVKSTAITTNAMEEFIMPLMKSYDEENDESSALLDYSVDFIKVLFWLCFILIVCFVVEAKLRQRKQKAALVVKE